MLPAAARYLFGYDVAQFRDMRVNLELLWPSEIDALSEQIWQAGFPQRVHVLSRFLRRRLANAVVPQASFLNAYLQLSAREGEANIGDLCRHVGVSSRTLNRQFHLHVGLSPKECARTLRLHKRLNALGEKSLNTDVVEGFADQSHWIREFKAMVGMSPHRYFRELPTLHHMDNSYWEGTNASHYLSRPSPVVQFPDAKPGSVFSPRE